MAISFVSVLLTTVSSLLLPSVIIYWAMAISSITFFSSYKNYFSLSCCLLIFSSNFLFLRYWSSCACLLCFFCLSSSFFCMLQIVWFNWASSTSLIICLETNAWWALLAFLEYCLYLGRPINVSSLSDTPSFVKTVLLSENYLSAFVLPWWMERHIFIKFWICLNFPFTAAFLMSKTRCQYS